MDLFEVWTTCAGSGSASCLPPEAQVVELALHLPGWQVAGLEKLAQERGLSIGQLLRRLIANLVREQAAR